MGWLKKNLVWLIIIVVLLCFGIFGIYFAGQRIFEAQSLAGKLAGDLDREYRYSVTARELIDRLIGNNEKIIRYNQQLDERLKRLERNSREALELLESAAHR